MTQEYNFRPVTGECGESGGQSFEGLATLKGCGGILPGCGLCRSSLAFPHSGRVSAYVGCNSPHDPAQPVPRTVGLGLPRGHPGTLDYIVRFPFANKAGS